MGASENPPGGKKRGEGRGKSVVQPVEILFFAIDAVITGVFIRPAIGIRAALDDEFRIVAESIRRNTGETGWEADGGERVNLAFISGFFCQIYVKGISFDNFYTIGNNNIMSKCTRIMESIFWNNFTTCGNGNV